MLCTSLNKYSGLRPNFPTTLSYCERNSQLTSGGFIEGTRCGGALFCPHGFSTHRVRLAQNPDRGRGPGGAADCRPRLEKAVTGFPWDGGEQKTQSVDHAEETSCLTAGFERFLSLSTKTQWGYSSPQILVVGKKKNKTLIHLCGRRSGV